MQIQVSLVVATACTVLQSILEYVPPFPVGVVGVGRGEAPSYLSGPRFV